MGAVRRRSIRRLRKPDVSWRQVRYLGRRKGSFTLTGRRTGVDYTICPGVLIPVHPGDVGQFGEGYKVVW